MDFLSKVTSLFLALTTIIINWFGAIATIFLTLLTVFILPLNWFGAIVSGIWLGVLGHWEAIVIGILSLVFGHYILMVPIMISVGLGTFGAMLFEREKKFLGFLFVLLSNLSTYIIIILWCMGTFHLLLNYENSENIFPLLLWAFGVATGPWLYFALKEMDSLASTLAAMFTQIGFFGTLIAYGHFNFTFSESVYPLIISLLICLILIGISALEDHIKKKRFKQLLNSISSEKQL